MAKYGFQFDKTFHYIPGSEDWNDCSLEDAKVEAWWGEVASRAAPPFPMQGIVPDRLPIFGLDVNMAFNWDKNDWDAVSNMYASQENSVMKYGATATEQCDENDPSCDQANAGGGDGMPHAGMLSDLGESIMNSGSGKSTNQKEFLDKYIIPTIEKEFPGCTQVVVAFRETVDGASQFWGYLGRSPDEKCGLKEMDCLGDWKLYMSAAKDVSNPMEKSNNITIDGVTRDRGVMREPLICSAIETLQSEPESSGTGDSGECSMDQNALDIDAVAGAAVPANTDQTIRQEFKRQNKLHHWKPQSCYPVATAVSTGTCADMGCEELTTAIDCATAAASLGWPSAVHAEASAGYAPRCNHVANGPYAGTYFNANSMVDGAGPCGTYDAVCACMCPPPPTATPPPPADSSYGERDSIESDLGESTNQKLVANDKFGSDVPLPGSNPGTMTGQS